MKTIFRLFQWGFLSSLVLLCFLMPPVQGQDQEGPVRISRILRVYDGDTFYVEVDGWPEIIGQGIGIRIIGIDTPEIRGSSPCVKAMAYKSRETLEALLTGKEIYLYNLYRGKYFRIVATVRVNGYNITEWMLARGVAKAWDGQGKKPHWVCDYSWFTDEEIREIEKGIVPKTRSVIEFFPYDDQ